MSGYRIYRYPYKPSSSTYKNIKKSSVYARTPSRTVAKKRMYTPRTYGGRRSYVPRVFGNPQSITERKYFDTEYSGAIGLVGADWSGTEADPTSGFFTPQQGTLINQRVGRKATVVSIKIRGHVVCAQQTAQSAGDAASLVRIIFFKDKQTNGVQVQGEEVISSGAGSGAINMFQSTTNFGRFKMLKDMRMHLDNPNAVFDTTDIEQAGLIKQFEFIFNFPRGYVVHFNAGNAGTIADIVDHSWHMLAGTQSTSLAPTLVYKCRICYLDL